MSAESARIADAEAFFDRLYGDDPPGYMAIWTLNDKRTMWLKARETATIACAVVKKAGSSDVYFGIGLHAEPLSEGERGTAEHVCAIPGLWADIDVRGPAHKAENLPPSTRDALDLIQEFPLRATLVVDSGHGLQAWWLFKELWTFDDAAEHARAAALVSDFQHTLGIKARAHGWEIDTTSDLARVLRPPGSINRKGLPVPVKIIDV